MGIHTHGLAVLGQCVHLIARVALALKVSLVIHTDLAADVWVLTLVYVCGEEQRSEPARRCVSAWAGRESLTATGLVVQKTEARRTRALKTHLEVSADVGAATVVV